MIQELLIPWPHNKPFKKDNLRDIREEVQRMAIPELKERSAEGLPTPIPTYSAGQSTENEENSEVSVFVDYSGEQKGARLFDSYHDMQQATKQWNETT